MQADSTSIEDKALAYSGPLLCSFGFLPRQLFSLCFLVFRAAHPQTAPLLSLNGPPIRLHAAVVKVFVLEPVQCRIRLG